MKTYYDAIVVGAGVAGLFCAYNLPRDLDVLVVAKEGILESNSYLAQGGIASLREDKDYASYFEDTLRAGHYQNDHQAVKIMIDQSRELIQTLDDLGVPFERDDKGYAYTREGAHSKPRILHYQDVTGKAITETLLGHVGGLENIELKPYTQMIDWVVPHDKIEGIVVSHEGKVQTVVSPHIILATGGIGGIFENSTNFCHITGDSIALALKYSVKLRDMNYIQIHPTALYTQRQTRRFLISEAVRGEGGILLNHKKERFVDELLPRDVVSVAIYEEMAKQHMPYVYLSLEPIGKERIQKHFPNIARKCQEEGYDVLREMIPVTPTQHYFMGGIAVDLEGKTSLEGLYAVGETACNGVHGANRLASNSLLESMVFAKRVAEAVGRVGKQVKPKSMLSCQKLYDKDILKKQYKALVLEEIKRRDEKFYEQWCRNTNQCG
ncbi:MAG: L-aspartate oxidase [Cellulosilyticaceae bacterium]